MPLMMKVSYQTTDRQAVQVYCQQVSDQKLSLPSSMKTNSPLVTAEPSSSVWTAISLPCQTVVCQGGPTQRLSQKPFLPTVQSVTIRCIRCKRYEGITINKKCMEGEKLTVPSGGSSGKFSMETGWSLPGLALLYFWIPILLVWLPGLCRSPAAGFLPSSRFLTLLF